LDRAGHGRSNSLVGRNNGHSTDDLAPRGYGYGFDAGAGPGSISYSRTISKGKAAKLQPAVGSTGEINDIDMKHVEGHWQGEIKVVRNAMPKGRTGMVDMYGNYFEKGYLYP